MATIPTVSAAPEASSHSGNDATDNRTLAIVGFGVFGQFLARAFTNSNPELRIVATSRTDYSHLAPQTPTSLPDVTQTSRSAISIGPPKAGPIISKFYVDVAQLLQSESPGVILFST